MIKKALLWLLILALALTAFFVIRHMTRTDEQRVRGVIDSLINNLESSNIYRCMWGMRRHLSARYVHRGENADVVIDKQLALAYIEQMKTEYTDFKVEVDRLDLTLSGDTARVIVTGRITAVRSDDASHRRVEVMTDGHNMAVIDLKKEEGDWVVIGSERLSRQ